VSKRKSTRRRKSRWSLKHLRIEVNLLVAKVGMIFAKDTPTPPPKARVRKAQQVVRVEYHVLKAEMPRDIRPYIAKPVAARRSPAAAYSAYPLFGVDQNGYPKNIVAETAVQLTGRARMKAVRKGDAPTALAAAVVEQIVVDAVRKGEQSDPDGRYWK
jgi:hypothetical protein